MVITSRICIRMALVNATLLIEEFRKQLDAPGKTKEKHYKHRERLVSDIARSCCSSTRRLFADSRSDHLSDGDGADRVGAAFELPADRGLPVRPQHGNVLVERRSHFGVAEDGLSAHARVGRLGQSVCVDAQR